MIHKIKLTIAFLLLICTCLPLGSCQKKQSLPLTEDKTNVQEIKDIPAGSSPFNSQTVDKDYLIAILELDIDDFSSWLFFISFIWQFPFLISVRKKRTSLFKQRVYSIFEFCLSLLSIFIIYSYIFNLFYTPMFFGYVAVLLIITYSLLTLFEFTKLKATE